MYRVLNNKGLIHFSDKKNYGVTCILNDSYQHGVSFQNNINSLVFSVRQEMNFCILLKRTLTHNFGTL
jgi:hypothetical protein